MSTPILNLLTKEFSRLKRDSSILLIFCDMCSTFLFKNQLLYVKYSDNLVPMMMTQKQYLSQIENLSDSSEFCRLRVKLFC